MSKFKEVLAQIWFMFLGLIGLWAVLYWGFYRGGGYVLHYWIIPAFTSAPHSAGATGVSDGGSGGWIGALKVIWSVGGAAIGAVVAAFVRRWFVYQTLRDKLKLLDFARKELIAKLETRTSDADTTMAISGGMLKYLFSDKEYAQIARYLTADTSMRILRTISAIDLVAAAAKGGTATVDIDRMRPTVLEQLATFNLEALLKELKLLRDDTDRTTSEVASLTVDKG
jgi:hypothetical protein